MDVISDLVLQAVASPWLYLAMFAVAVIDGFFPPVPSETVLVASAAVAASTGRPDLVALGLVAAAGAAAGDNIAFAVGRRTGSARFAWMRRPRVAGALARAGAALDRRGAGLILGARFIPVGRVAVNLSAGALAYPWRRFALLSVAAGLCWAAYSIGIGLLAGAWLKDQPLLSATLGVVLAVGIGLLVDRLLAVRARRVTASA
ncbi:membrane protein DedA with SNARE-associated domain [Microbacterium trichothecenolyticum]|uniref:DedA family protein n=1 Tax=Microbacterium trichothecenolyticum TaxID=69370 RepID=UPI0028580AEE|nr:VTT domain-containing protein [Microbacterium trichothecenolyticum]MDR7185929.1 membrane protein DedA with SNARE-associated domain [Microbacterium trichothecenolyticum]